MRYAILALLLLLPLAAPAQHQHEAQTAQPSAEAAHHAFLDAERGAIERGEGFGMALAADRAGYPGPKHALDLQAELALTAAQVAEMQRLRAAMLEKARARGRELLAAEAQLEELFRRGAAEPELREQTARIGALRAELRWVHLETHLAARAVLTDEQLRRYHHLRHGSAAHAH